MGYKWPTVTLKPNESPAVTWFNKQTQTRNNVINGLITGTVGQGKSYLGLSLLYQKNPEFNLNEQMFFSAAKLMKTINREGFFAKKGKEIFYDESAVDLANTNWQQLICKAIFSFFLTHRSRNYVFLMCSPQMNYLTKPIRTLINFKIKALGWDKNNKSLGVPFFQEWNGDMDKAYTKRLIVRQKSQPSQFCNQIRVPLPPKPFMKEYERLKSEFQAKHAEDLCNQLDAIENKDKDIMKPPIAKGLRDVYDDVVDGLSLNQMMAGRYSNITNEEDKNKMIIMIRVRIKSLRDKGYDIVTEQNSYGETKWELRGGAS